MVWFYNIFAALINVFVIVAFKILCNHGALSSESAGVVRNFAGMLVLLPVMFLHAFQKPKEVFENVSFKTNFWLGLIGGASMVLWPVVFVNIESHIAMTFAFALPFVANLLFVIWFKDQIPLYVWVAKCFSLFGIMIILRPQIEKWTIYHTLGIVCVFLWAFSAGLTKLSAKSKPPLMVSLYYYVIFGTLGTLIFSVQSLKAIDFSFWVLFLSIGAINTLGNYFMFMSFKHGDGYLVQMMEFLKFVFIVIIDIALFDVEIQNATIFGSIVVLISIFAIFFLQKKA